MRVVCVSWRLGVDRHLTQARFFRRSDLLDFPSVLSQVDPLLKAVALLATRCGSMNLRVLRRVAWLQSVIAEHLVVDTPGSFCLLGVVGIVGDTGSAWLDKRRVFQLLEISQALV